MSDSDTQQEDTQQDQSPQESPAEKRRRRWVMGLIALLFIAAGIGWLLYDQLVLAYEETTDDAYTHGNRVSVSARSNGTVLAVYTDNTQHVKSGQQLVALDPVDTSVALHRAAAQLAQAVRQARQLIAQAHQADAAVLAQRASYQRAQAQYERRVPLLKQRAAAKESVDSARRQMEAAKGAYQQATATAQAAHAQVDGLTIPDFPVVKQARAAYINAWINDKRHTIIAPVSGYVAQRQVQVGQHIEAGQPLLTVVPAQPIWVEANFKETQLAHLRVGQPVTLTTDAYPDTPLHGKVAGLSPGTGSVFSLLPAQNATGNWIKVIQRLPVRIELDPQQLQDHPLQIGLSTTVTVDTHDRSGQRLAPVDAKQPTMATDIYDGQLAQAEAAADAVINANRMPNG